MSGSKQEAVRAAEADQERLRERINPGWREQLARHRAQLHLGEETKGLSFREIVQRAMLLNGVDPVRKRRK